MLLRNLFTNTIVLALGYVILITRQKGD